MPAQLNIKDEETVRLVRQYAAETGRTATATVKEAIENDRRARAAAIERKVAAAREIVAEFQAQLPDDWRGRPSREIMDAIYDEAEPDGFMR
jgi:antitoxin VapB